MSYDLHITKNHDRAVLIHCFKFTWLLLSYSLFSPTVLLVRCHIKGIYIVVAVTENVNTQFLLV